MVSSLNKRNIIVSVSLIYCVLVLGTAIYAATSFKIEMPNSKPAPVAIPEPHSEPQPTPPTDLNSSIAVPDDYPKISELIDQAAEGATIYLGKGTYEGPINQTVVINKTLSLIGEDAKGTIIKLYPAYNVTWILTTPFFSYSDAITIAADACKLLNLTVIIANPGGYISATGNQIQIIGNNITTGSTTGIKVNGSYCNITDNVMGGHIQLNGSFNEVSKNSLSAIYIDGFSNVIKDNACENLGLSYSTKNVVSGNRVSTSTRSYSGISLTNSSDNFLQSNYVSGFGYGLKLWLSSGNTITANTIADSLDASISLGGSSNNTIYLNNFVDNMWGWIPYVYDSYSDPNVRAAVPNMTASTNFWDNGKEGNYWAGYNVSDVNGDGIGDTPYVINANNQDNFPLMAPRTIPG